MNCPPPPAGRAYHACPYHLFLSAPHMESHPDPKLPGQRIIGATPPRDDPVLGAGLVELHPSLGTVTPHSCVHVPRARPPATNYACLGAESLVGGSPHRNVRSFGRGTEDFFVDTVLLVMCCVCACVYASACGLACVRVCVSRRSVIVCIIHKLFKGVQATTTDPILVLMQGLPPPTMRAPQGNLDGEDRRYPKT